MKKVVRLTESQLKDVIKRVIKETEQQPNIDFAELEKELQDAVIGKSFQISISKNEPVQFKIEKVTAPKEKLEDISGKVLQFEGKTGLFYNGKINYDPSSENIYVEYMCATSSEDIRELTQPQRVSFYKKGNMTKGTFSPGGANIIEKAWCQKVPPMSGEKLY